LSQAYQPWVSAVLHETTCSVSVVMVSIRWVAFLGVWSRAQGTLNHACTCHVALIIRYEWCVQAVGPHAHDQRSPGTMTEPLVSLTRRKAIPNYTRRHMKQRRGFTAGPEPCGGHVREGLCGPLLAGRPLPCEAPPACQRRGRARRRFSRLWRCASLRAMIGAQQTLSVPPHHPMLPRCPCSRLCLPHGFEARDPRVHACLLLSRSKGNANARRVRRIRRPHGASRRSWRPRTPAPDVQDDAAVGAHPRVRLRFQLVAVSVQI
jgi:hypothetical protein